MGPDFEFERAALARGFGRIAGVDEVGRGPLAGPVTAAAVVFETARIVMIVLLMKFVLGDYIRHIAPLDFPFEIDPRVGERKGWKRSNWISIEFGLLYRWHTLVPDKISLGDDMVEVKEALFNPDLVRDRGLAALITAASAQKAGRIGLHNTPPLFTEPMTMWHEGRQIQNAVQKRTIQMGRRANLKPYSAYRAAFRLPRVRSFLDLTADPQTAQELSDLYPQFDDLDWYVGLLAEKHEDGLMMGDLMMRMVAFDAFTHIFSNPLLAPGVYHPRTFSDAGWKIIQSTRSLEDMVGWVVRDPCHVSFKA